MLVTWILLLTGFSSLVKSIKFHASPDSKYIEINEKGSFDIWITDNVYSEVEIELNVSSNNDDVLFLDSPAFIDGSNKTVVDYNTSKPGNAKISFSTPDYDISEQNDVYVHIYVIRSHALDIFNDVIGWIYFAAWSISFYPQIIENFRRRSVVGLNFDFLAYNLLGFSIYSMFNIGLYCIPYIQNEYHEENPGQIIPVQLNDVFFAVHASLITMVTIGTCFFFKRDKQTVSWFCRIFLILSLLFIVVLAIFTITGDFKNCTWLNFLNWTVYIKLVISFIKYVPQAWMNYKRKSTVGWSIGNVLLDCTGGTLSIMQSFLVSYNSNDWPSLYADPVKLGLGYLSIMFDILFMVQHYILYRHAKDDSADRTRSYKIFDNVDSDSEPSWNPSANYLAED